MNGVGRGDKNDKKGKNTLLSRETVGMTLLLFSVIVFFIAATGPYVFGDIGVAITAFFVGVFGFFVYPLLLLVVYLSAVLVSGKRRLPVKWVLKAMLLLAAVFFIVHAATAERFFGKGYGAYLNGCWSAASSSLAGGTGGGAVFGLIAYPVRAVLSLAGSYVLYALVLAGVLLWIVMGTSLKKRIFRTSPRVRELRGEEKGTERGEEKGEPVSYEDIPAPERAAALPAEPARPASAVYGDGQSFGAQQPVYGHTMSAPTAQKSAQTAQSVQTTPVSAPASIQSAQQPAQPSEPRSSRDILFSGDPASSYRNNLIFDRDSRFNTYPRRSSIAPVPQEDEPAANASVAPRRSSVAPVQPTERTFGGTMSAESVSDSARNSFQSSAPAPYSEQYAAHAERPAMPRRVTEERPVPRAFDDDLNYPQTPSYRAPEPPAEEHDYYENDVPFEGLSSQPNVDDAAEDIPAESARPSYEEQPEEPVRPSYNAEPEEPARPSYNAEPEEPARPSYHAEPEELARPSYNAEPEEPARPSYNAEPEEPVRPSYNGRAAEPSVQPAEDRPLAARMLEVPPAPPAPRTGETPVSREEFHSLFSRSVSEERTQIDPNAEPLKESRVFGSPVRDSAAGMFDEDEDEDGADYRTPDMPVPSVRERAVSDRTVPAGRSIERPLTDRPVPEAPAPKKHVYKAYVRPSLDNLASYRETASVSQEEIEQNSAIIVETLGGFRVDAEVVKVTVGSAVTRYDIDIPRNVTVSAVIKRDAEIAMRLHARDGVNIYSNSEAGAISIEVPNSARATVGLKSVMASEEYVNSKPTALAFAIGKDVEGRNVCGNIVKMKHLLVAGSTGSGKSVCLNSMLISLICKYSPEELRLILIDPKKVEFAVYDGLPHLMINEIIADAQKAVSALNWAIKEMERRYNLFEKKTRSGVNVHNVDEYNASLTEDEERLAKIVIVVDELADLMSVAKKEIEDRIQRLAQKARAAGMHLVIATQRPSVDVITGVIKGNLPTRLAFRVIQEVDSRTILDESGAQKLLGLGDMLYRTEGMFNCLRVQGAFVGSEEVQRIVEDIKANNEAYFDESVADFINREEGSTGGYDGDGDDGAVDPQYIKALAIVVKLGQASISLIQRKCSVGYNHAGKIIEWMELMGYISAFDGKAKARTVLLTKEDFEAKYGDLDG